MLTADEALAWVEKLHKVIADRRPEVEMFDDYYRGKHKLTMASDKWAEFHARRYERFSDNWCGVVTDAVSQRLQVQGIRLDEDDTTRSDAERTLWGDWLANDLERQAAQGVLESLRSRRSAVLVWGNSDDEPVVTWEDPGQTAVAYDPETRARVAGLKTWVDDDTEYATLYTVDEVWKYRRSTSGLILPAGAGGWQPRDVPGEAWPLEHDMGAVPLVEVRNRGPLRGEPLSEIGGAVPMQDSINLLWAYLFNAADFASLSARVIIGAEAPSIPKLDENGNDTGQRIPLDLKKMVPGGIAFVRDEAGTAKIAQWDAAKLDVFTDVIEVAVGHLAAQTRTPQHYLILGRNANPPSADALKASEAGLVAKANESQLFFGADIREIFRLMAVVRGRRDWASAVTRGSLVWADTENRSEAQRADASQKWRASGLSIRGLLERYWSSDPVEVDRQMAMIEAEADDPTMARLLSEFRSVEPGVTADAATGN